MAETRSERTPYAGLLALMEADARSEGWAYPYWNIHYLDALLHGLAAAPRTGTPPLLAPQNPPTLSLLTTGGSIPAERNIEVVQTFVDAYGRETAPGPAAMIYTGDGIPDPDTPATLGTPTEAGTGYPGGLLEVTYTWVDSQGGETLPAPIATVQLPYRPVGLYSQVQVTLPCAPGAVGAAGANIYICHQGGSVVLAKRIASANIDHVTLDGNTADCYQTPPYVSTVGAANSVEIYGQPAPPEATKTRFYVRNEGESWRGGDHRLRINGVDEWDARSVTYPLVYRGETLAPGYPPPVSLVKAIRPIDLATEVEGVLSKEHMEAAGVEVKWVNMQENGLPDWAGALADHGPGKNHGDLLLLVVNNQFVHYPALLYYWDALNLEGPRWSLVNPLAGIYQYPHGPSLGIPGSLLVVQEHWGGMYCLVADQTGDPNDQQKIPLKLWYQGGLGDRLGFFGVWDSLEVLQWEEYEPWNSGYVMAYVADTDAWYRYIPGVRAQSVGGTNPVTNLASGSDNQFLISVNGADPVTITLDQTVCTDQYKIQDEITKRLRLAGLPAYCCWQQDHFVIYGEARDGATVVVTNAETNNCADDLKLGLTNGGTEIEGEGRWTKCPSSAMRGTFPDMESLPQIADEGDSAFVLDCGNGSPGLCLRQNETWTVVGIMTPAT